MKPNLFLKRKVSLLSGTLALMMATSSLAYADGFYVSGKVSSTTLDHTISRAQATPGLPVADTAGVFTADATDVSGGVALGYEFATVEERMYIGIEGFYNFENASSRNIASVLITDVDLEATYGARVLAGFNVTDKFSLYVHGGATVVDFEVTNSYTFAPPVRSESFTETAFSYGVGAGYDVTDNATFFVEYTQIDDVEFDGIPEVAGGTGRVNPNELDLSSLSAGIKLKLN